MKISTEEEGMIVDPKAWFDQFPEAPGWEHDQWCARHWAPCPILGANGIGAATELISVFINEVASGGGAAAMNAQMQAAGRLCCTLGDERMYDRPSGMFLRTVQHDRQDQQRW